MTMLEKYCQICYEIQYYKALSPSHITKHQVLGIFEQICRNIV